MIRRSIYFLVLAVPALFVVVLVLHVVAVGGIYAFNAIKAHQPAGYEDTETTGAGLPEAEPMNTVAALRDSGNTYTVVRGDTPVSIARKLDVPNDDLIRLNNIEDPRKLKIGLKLKVPMKRTTI